MWRSREVNHPEPDESPPRAVLYSEYVRRKPSKPRPVDSAGQVIPIALLDLVDPLDREARNRLVLALEQHQPNVVVTDGRFNHITDVMAQIAIEHMVNARADLSLRSRYPSRSPYQALAAMILDPEVPLALDAVGAWVDSYARLPGTSWQRDKEAGFLAAVDAALSGTIFAVRGREIVLREDLGASVLVDTPMAALLTANPALRGVDAKLREALAELDAGQAGDAVTDAGTALQMLLDHLGFQGTQLGDQIKAARNAGWLAGIDTPLATAVESIAAWVASVRNQRGDAHHGPPPDLRDAELVVRVVGLLTLRFG